MLAGVTQMPVKVGGWLRSKVRRPYVLLLICFAVLFDGAEAVYLVLSDNDAALLIGVASVMQLALVIGMYWHSVLCGAADILFGTILGMVPGVVFPSWFWGIWLAFAMLGYCRKFNWFAVLFIVGAIARLYAVLILNGGVWTVSGFITYMGTICLAFILGFVISERQMMERIRGELWEMKIKVRDKERLGRNIRIASQLHDSTTRYLAEISLIAERLRYEEPVEFTHDLDFMQDCSRRALSGIREAIDVLGDNYRENGDGIGREVSLGALVHEEAERERCVLSAKGILGSIRVDDDSRLLTSAVSNDVQDELIGLINQIFVNVGLHARRGDDAYYFYAFIGKDEIVINQLNFINENDGILRSEIIGAGRGLALHKGRIESLGGTLNTKTEDGEWILRAAIPLG